ncbi:hypothetical protein NUM3379_29910 [Kineococcus sp. NUM-3379]
MPCARDGRVASRSGRGVLDGLTGGSSARVRARLLGGLRAPPSTQGRGPDPIWTTTLARPAQDGAAWGAPPVSPGPPAPARARRSGR